MLINTITGAKINMECKHITAQLMQNVHMMVLYYQYMLIPKLHLLGSVHLQVSRRQC